MFKNSVLRMDPLRLLRVDVVVVIGLVFLTETEGQAEDEEEE